jgi:hypothetical protein
LEKQHQHIEVLATTIPAATPEAGLNPPYPERLSLTKVVPQPDFDLLGELKNLYVKIPLLKALREVPIYAKTIR